MQCNNLLRRAPPIEHGRIGGSPYNPLVDFNWDGLVDCLDRAKFTNTWTGYLLVEHNGC